MPDGVTDSQVEKDENAEGHDVDCDGEEGDVGLARPREVYDDGAVEGTEAVVDVVGEYEELRGGEGDGEGPGNDHQAMHASLGPGVHSHRVADGDVAVDGRR